ncbi:hypothetical protein [Gordonia hydrophobica]|uniref:Lipoprotein n=1 Tax=Gordonia hydrophobica TaxID=40516 RepID=A0ABZ2U4R5_9ACTN|nr:hypothetical protein [Gordonia hydrophobica]MBM7368308.1 hypothetical protein [Gordonia hydrophobica]
MTRTMKLAATVLFGASIALAGTACGSENEAASSNDGSTPAVMTPPSDSSVPVVGGPKPRSSTTAVQTDESTTSDGDKTCGATKGPDGALYIHIVEGDLTCDVAKSIAKEYGPLIATGAPQTVSGWDCGPSNTAGEMARCTKGSQAFALMVQ